VLFAIDRAGLVGVDGATHSGNYDISYLRCLPNMTIMAPADESECRNMLFTAYQHKGPTAVRYPRGKGIGTLPSEDMLELEIGKSAQLLAGSRIAILMFGSLRKECEEAAIDLGATLVNMRFVKPLDETAILELSLNHEVLVTVEDNAIQGGAGSAVNECIMRHAVDIRVLNLGIPDRYIAHGTREDQLDECGLSAPEIVKQVSAYDGGKYCISLLTPVASASSSN